MAARFSNSYRKINETEITEVSGHDNDALDLSIASNLRSERDRVLYVDQSIPSQFPLSSRSIASDFSENNVPAPTDSGALHSTHIATRSDFPFKDHIALVDETKNAFERHNSNDIPDCWVQPTPISAEGADGDLYDPSFPLSDGVINQIYNGQSGMAFGTFEAIGSECTMNPQIDPRLQTTCIDTELWHNPDNVYNADAISHPYNTTTSPSNIYTPFSIDTMWICGNASIARSDVSELTHTSGDSVNDNVANMSSNDISRFAFCPYDQCDKKYPKQKKNDQSNLRRHMMKKHDLKKKIKKPHKETQGIPGSLLLDFSDQHEESGWNHKRKRP